MLDQFRETDDPSVGDTIVKACCLISTPQQSDLAAMHEMADKALSVDEERWDGMYRALAQTAKALVEYRSGNDPAAIEWAEKSLARSADVPAWLDSISPDVPPLRIASVVVAMAHLRNGDQELAIKELDEFEQFLRENSPLRTGASLYPWNIPHGPSWIDWLICEILLREVTQ
jgi:hypothetical protein